MIPSRMKLARELYGNIDPNQKMDPRGVTFMRNVTKIAAKDAFDWARAEMFFGEGAGTRRKLLSAQIESKTVSIPGYQEAFEKALGKQDYAKHAIAAAKERKYIDRGRFISRNVRGILTGNPRSLTTGAVVVLGVWYVAKETGADEDIKVYVRKQYYLAKFKYAEWKAKQEQPKVYEMGEKPNQMND